MRKSYLLSWGTLSSSVGLWINTELRTTVPQIQALTAAILIMAGLHPKEQPKGWTTNVGFPVFSSFVVHALACFSAKMCIAALVVPELSKNDNFSKFV